MILAVAAKKKEEDDLLAEEKKRKEQYRLEMEKRKEAHDKAVAAATAQIENDPENIGNGKIHDYSIIDYNNETEYACPQENVTIQNNGLTQMEISLIPQFDKLEIEDTEIINLNIYENVKTFN